MSACENVPWLPALQECAPRIFKKVNKSVVPCNSGFWGRPSQNQLHAVTQQVRVALNLTDFWEMFKGDQSGI